MIRSKWEKQRIFNKQKTEEKKKHKLARSGKQYRRNVKRLHFSYGFHIENNGQNNSHKSNWNQTETHNSDSIWYFLGFYLQRNREPIGNVNECIK